jgi:peptidoglycan/LPS O-acetylase OafA/YrhL
MTPSTPVEFDETSRNIGLDAVRATAVVCVLIGHFGPAFLFTSGMAQSHVVPKIAVFGVELFFALSGFLIGSILLRILEHPARMRSFYTFVARRFMRTLPIYFVVLLLLTVFRNAEDGPGSILLHAVMMQNFAWPIVSPSWFRVSWSLAIEEWSYLLLGFSIVLRALNVRKFSILLYVLTIIVIANVIRVAAYTSNAYPVAVNAENWQDFKRITVIYRLDAVCYGMLLAFLYRHCRSWVMERAVSMFNVALVATVLLVAVDFRGMVPFALEQAVLWIFTVPLIAILMAMLIPFTLTITVPDGPARIIRWVSARSYCIYLIHFTLIDTFGKAFYYNGISPFYSLFASLFVTFAVADLSWRFLERPILDRRPKQS